MTMPVEKDVTAFKCYAILFHRDRCERIFLVGLNLETFNEIKH